MKRKKVWRFYCEFCKKAGCSGGHIKRHEERCTMNPNRVCGMCKMTDNEQIDIKDMLAILPDPTEYIIKDDFLVSFNVAFDKIVDDALSKLRELTGNCPACILSALRQKGIPVPCAQNFHFKAECDNVWADINEANNQYGNY